MMRDSCLDEDAEVVPMAKFEFGSWLNKGASLLGGFRPAAPAALGAVALTFLFAAVMPMAWVRGLAWNLYLDRLSPLFVPPVGDAGRLALAIGMAVIAGLLAVLVALAMTQSDAHGNEAKRRHIAARAEPKDDGGDALLRRRADRHPDDAPRPPIRAARDLPAGGLGPTLGRDLPEMAENDRGDDLHADDQTSGIAAINDEPELPNLVLAELADDDGEPFLLGELAPPEDVPPAPVRAGLQSVDPTENSASLGAMVARFESGMERRRKIREAGSTKHIATEAANEDDEPPIDFALEAALSTLQRMARSAVN